MSNRNEAELRRVWGVNFDAKMEDALTAFDALNDAERALVEAGDARHLSALASMNSEAYRNPKHADHQRVTAEVQSFFTDIAGTEPPLL